MYKYDLRMYFNNVNRKNRMRQQDRCDECVAGIEVACISVLRVE
jgi:hypothetical protein